MEEVGEAIIWHKKEEGQHKLISVLLKKMWFQNPTMVQVK